MPGTPLRGRDEQLALLTDRLDRAVAGRGSVVLVEGRPGRGRTGLLAAAARAARAEPLRLILARPWSTEVLGGLAVVGRDRDGGRCGRGGAEPDQEDRGGGEGDL